MSQVSSFVKTTFLGGVVAIVPLSVIAFILWSIYTVMVEVVGAMKEVLPFSPLVNTLIVGAAALVGLLLLCFAAGLALRTAVGNRMKASVDTLLERFIPLYSAARKMTSRLAGEATSEFTPAEIDIHGTGAHVLGFAVEDLPDGRTAVFVPFSPAPSFGQVYLVPKSQVQPIEAHLGEFIGPITDWGAGAGRLFLERTR